MDPASQTCSRATRRGIAESLPPTAAVERGSPLPRYVGNGGPHPCPIGLGMGFTITELMVVVVVVVIIMTLVLAAGHKMKASAETSLARSILAGLVGHAVEYEVATTRPVNHLSDDLFGWSTAKRKNAPGAVAPLNAVITGSGTTTSHQHANRYIERFVWAAYQLPTLNNALPSLGEDSFLDSDSDGFLDLVDPWGKPIAYALRVVHDADSDDDFLPEHNDPFFASAGADGVWGQPQSRGEFSSQAAYDSYKQTDDYRVTLDNLYSFDLDRSASVRGN